MDSSKLDKQSGWFGQVLSRPAFLFLALMSLFALLSWLCRWPSLLFTVTLLLWIHNVAWAFDEFRRNIIFLIFHASFFVFLMGRLVTNGIFGYRSKAYWGLFDLRFSLPTVCFILFCLYLSLFFLFLSYFRQQVRQGLISQEQAEAYSPLGNIREGGGAWHSFLEKLSAAWTAITAFFSRLLKKIEGGLSYLFIRGDSPQAASKRQALFKRDKWDSSLTWVALVFFLVTIAFHIVQALAQIAYARKVGYFGTYLNPLAQNQKLYIIGDMYDVAFYIYLSGRPSKKQLTIPLLLYLTAGILFALAGRRKEFMLDILLLATVSIIFYRPKGFRARDLSRKKVIFFLVLVLLLVLFLYAIGQLRQKKAVLGGNIFKPILQFFYEQGVSVRIIGHTKDLLPQIPQPRFYSIGTIREFIHYKLIGHYIKGQPVPLGQTIDRGENSYLFSQVLAYQVMPFDYLQGRGTGSSYIAELYVDFRLVGVILGSWLYGLIIAAFSRAMDQSSRLKKTLVLLMVWGFYFTPRSGYSSFLTTAFSMRQMLGLVMIWFFAWILMAIRNALAFNRQGGAEDGGAHAV